MKLYYIKKVNDKWEFIEFAQDGKILFHKVKTAYQGLQSIPTLEARHIEVIVTEENDD